MRFWEFLIHIWNKKRIYWSIQYPLLLRHVLTYAVLYFSIFLSRRWHYFT